MYTAYDQRYNNSMKYRKCGCSGIQLPMLSLGLWHNFGGVNNQENCRAVLHSAFDAGITHFDLANNYGPPPGSAEEMFGNILHSDFAAYRDEIIISSKAGYRMWDGPYGDFGSRKYLIASCDQSLKRMGLEYLDIFYHHRPDPDTPLEETMGALAQLVRQGKALYVGISNYPADMAHEAISLLKEMGVPCLIHQARYSMLDRWTENGLLDVLAQEGVGCICFSPLAQGLLTNRYLSGSIPQGSRAEKAVFLKPEHVTKELLTKLNALNDFAVSRGRTLARMAISWILRDERNTSVLIGASSPEQLAENIQAISDEALSPEEINEIERILHF